MRICRPIQPMCDDLAARGIAHVPCIAELNNTLLPWSSGVRVHNEGNG
jgi:hypothetical protein